MKAKHTPGPWFAGLDRHCPDLVHTKDPVSGGAEKLVGVGRAQPDGDFDEACANARLIAAAPDLLAACEVTVAVRCEGCGYSSDPNCNPEKCVYAIAKAAIAKAKGEA